MTQYLLKNELNSLQTIANNVGLSPGLSPENFKHGAKLSCLCSCVVCTRAILFSEMSVVDRVEIMF